MDGLRGLVEDGRSELLRMGRRASVRLRVSGIGAPFSGNKGWFPTRPVSSGLSDYCNGGGDMSSAKSVQALPVSRCRSYVRKMTKSLRELGFAGPASPESRPLGQVSDGLADASGPTMRRQDRGKVKRSRGEMRVTSAPPHSKHQLLAGPLGTPVRSLVSSTRTRRLNSRMSRREKSGRVAMTCPKLASSRTRQLVSVMATAQVDRGW